MKRRDWLLLLINEEIDPIRIQKGMFLFAMESGAPQTEKYEFEPYNWGPCSFAIYGDLDLLHAEGLIARIPVQGRSWSTYRRTVDGDAAAQRLVSHADPKLLEYLESISAAVMNNTFNQLLRAVYERYPDFTAKSLFRG